MLLCSRHIQSCADNKHSRQHSDTNNRQEERVMLLYVVERCGRTCISVFEDKYKVLQGFKVHLFRLGYTFSCHNSYVMRVLCTSTKIVHFIFVYLFEVC